ncbi:MAG: formamidase [Acidaminobacter sp.]|nr:formamidase [Acidaminobacter sp.]
MQSIGSVLPGERFSVKTHDCFHEQIFSEEQTLSEIDYDRLNPATGPIYVEGARPGDLLKITIHDIQVADRGIAMVVPGEGVLGDLVEKGIIKVLPIENNVCRFNTFEFPIEPMIGVIGTAPSAVSGTWGTASPWTHGGNMDTRDITSGSILYLPVNTDGALLALGDCHAAMGDGELCFTGLEVQALVELTADLIPGVSQKWPMLETPDAFMVIASGDTVDEALREATEQAVSLLKTGMEMTFEEAYLLASLYVDLKISQIVDPKKTVRASIPKTVLSEERLRSTILCPAKG